MEVITNTDHSIRLTEITDGMGTPRQLNIHAYRVANNQNPRLSLAVLDKKGKTLGYVILDADGMRYIVSEILSLI
jgi:hypothetical protein